MKKMHEEAMELGHTDLVLSQLAIEVLQELQMHMTQEMSLRIENTSRKLVKVTNENIGLELEFSKVKKDHNEVEYKV
jgi:hypothetical protein